MRSRRLPLVAATLANSPVTLTAITTGSVGFRQTTDRNAKLALWTILACEQRSARKCTCTSTCITSDCLMRALLGFWRRPFHISPAKTVTIPVLTMLPASYASFALHPDWTGRKYSVQVQGTRDSKYKSIHKHASKDPAFPYMFRPSMSNCLLIILITQWTCCIFNPLISIATYRAKTELPTKSYLLRTHISGAKELMQPSQVAATAIAALLLGALPQTAAHGDEHTQTAQEHQPPVAVKTQETTPTYFRHSHYAGWMYAHIALMIISWVAVLPPALMLSVARSRYRLPAQMIFHGINGLGIFTGFVYNHATPDLYVSNSHHPVGWIVTSLTIVWTLLSLANACASAKKQHDHERIGARMSGQSQTANDDLEEYVDTSSSYRFSRDSGNFSGGSRSNSSELMFEKRHTSPIHDGQEHGDEEQGSATESSGFLDHKKVNSILSKVSRTISGGRISTVLRASRVVLEKFLPILGFVAITSGFVVYGGIFQGREIYSGLAHYAKGGIFFWYGLLTLGRWMGAFADFGWAWNVRPNPPPGYKWKSYIPSAEFTESFVIWLYGSSNIFLEHLNNWGGTWSPQDFEHVSITILFFGGGLLGMMIESRALRDLTGSPTSLHNNTIEDIETDISGSKLVSDNLAQLEQQRQHPIPSSLSLNPMPALTILFLGMMMSGHHQESMISTMLHAQWGTLFTGFALSRAATYLTLYIKPPTSRYPSRPPSELVAAFCLTAGGIMFMNSAHDSVKAIEDNGLDAMTIFTLTIGLTGVILAWELACYTLKVWAARKEERRRRL
jgi:hypothetical protein